MGPEVVAQVLEYIPNIHEAPGPIPSTEYPTYMKSQVHTQHI